MKLKNIYWKLKLKKYQKKLETKNKKIEKS